MHDLGSASCSFGGVPFQPKTPAREIDDALDAAGVPQHGERGSLTTAERVRWLAEQRDKWRASSIRQSDFDRDGFVSFEEALRSLINRKSKENGSNTPDYVLADYLCRCLEAFDRAVRERTKWHGPAVSAAEAQP